MRARVGVRARARARIRAGVGVGVGVTVGVGVGVGVRPRARARASARARARAHRAVGEQPDVLDHRLAVCLAADELGTLVVLQGGREDFGRRGRLGVDQHLDGQRQ